ncbi:peptide-methionine (S)-S-oxide reductase MsrA [Undibacterium sp. Jales W-56]|uniref:peptide-methionine (S)-S-oxide reductase MsrA n=1 Tax=Undibacterium sp. Jales W-56 TaxID=2897325 RepID=UPI0021D37C95|nr:peptide-methionine (S)-S-oxide reductase MsrA [Undibacterium sp. Jales W-56]MCU6432516.1 peptide-methionine (S)-S-oxide reductase MsrA [Undibacterium sp. Jales W-56]
MALEIATFGGGCFWCTEAVFQQIRGIKSVEPGYSGGQVDNPSYEQICEGSTGHAEVVRLIFDNAVVSYKALVEIFFAIHDPTTLNRQGGDVGTQYRSVIFCQTEQQMTCATTVMAELAAKSEKPLVTALEMAPVFYPAEDYHHNYFKMNSRQRYCTLVVAPKVAQVRQLFSTGQPA